MDFELTEEQKILQSTVRSFAENELAPVADELDQKEEFPWENFKGLAKLGLTGMILPVEYGGSDSGELSMNKSPVRALLPLIFWTATWYYVRARSTILGMRSKGNSFCPLLPKGKRWAPMASLSQVPGVT